MFSDLRTYDEIEPIPEVPKPPPFKPVVVSWLIIAATTLITAKITYGTINLAWLVWGVWCVRRYRAHRELGKKFDHDIAEWEVHADAHHDKVMRQLQQFANREWN